MFFRYTICLFFLSVISILLIQCVKSSPTPLTFDELELKVTFDRIGQLKLEANLDQEDLPDEYGFYFSEIEDRVEFENVEVKIVVANLENKLFSTEVQVPDLTATYYFKAYARYSSDSYEPRLISSRIESHSFEIKLDVENSPRPINNSIEVIGSISGLELLDRSAQAHGFIYSKDSNTILELGSIGADTTNLGRIASDGIFRDTLLNLDFNTKYFVRTWVQSLGRSYYSEEIETVQIQDGWILIESESCEKPIVNGRIAINDDQIFYTTCIGEGQSLDCATGAPFVLNRLTLEGAETRMEVSCEIHTVHETSLSRFDAVAFVIGDTIYFGTGISDASPEKDLLRYIPKENRWLNSISLGGGFKRRGEATVFVIGKKAYIGMGCTDCDSLGELPFLYEFDPVRRQTKRMTAMPFQRNPTSPKLPERGRKQAIAYVFDDKYAYVGGGVSENLLLTDFWRFDPPSAENNRGSWSEAPIFFPGQGRIRGVSFMIQDKGYWGTGENFNTGPLRDFWEFDPNRNEPFHEVSPMPTYGRSNGLGFSNDGYGYVGYGETRKSNGNIFENLILRDFWQYVPKEL